MSPHAGTRCPPPFVFMELLKELSKDELHWFPMRVTYSRELTAKAFLESLGIECFIPMHYEYVEGKHPRHRKLVPAVKNLIFIHSTRGHITEMKMFKKEMASLRYMLHPILDKESHILRHEILTVPDKQMENFIRVASVGDNRVFYIENLDFAGKPGQRVRVTDGDFAGVEGVIKRIKKNKCVVVQIEGVAAVAIAFLPAAFLQPLIDEASESTEK